VKRKYDPNYFSVTLSQAGSSKVFLSMKGQGLKGEKKSFNVTIGRGVPESSLFPGGDQERLKRPSFSQSAGCP